MSSFGFARLLAATSLVACLAAVPLFVLGVPPAGLLALGYAAFTALLARSTVRRERAHRRWLRQARRETPFS